MGFVVGFRGGFVEGFELGGFWSGLRCFLGWFRMVLLRVCCLCWSIGWFRVVLLV